MATTANLIGADMAQILDGSTLHNNISEQHAASSTTSSAANSSAASRATAPLHYPPCLLLSSQKEGEHRIKRILLQGPGQSGRTSMAMDLAYACAARSTATNSGAASCHCLLQPCCCTSVIFYRLASNAPTGQPLQSDSSRDDFPLSCRYTGDSKALVGATLMRHLNENDDCWDPAILRHIRIQYVHSTRELLEDLLGMLGKPAREHPTGAIIVDDLDLLITQGGSRQGSSSWDSQPPQHRPASQYPSSEATILMMQAMAVLVDTSHALQRMHGVLPLVLATTLDRTKLVLPFVDVEVSLRSTTPGRASLSFVGGNHGGSSTTSSSTRWKAHFRKVQDDNDDEGQERNMSEGHMGVVEYCVASDVEGFTGGDRDGRMAAIDWVTLPSGDSS